MNSRVYDGVAIKLIWRMWATLVLALCVGACAGARRDDADPPATSASLGGAASEYIIGPGDVLKVVVAQNPELNADVPVRPDGKISTPLASDIVAVGKSPTQIAGEVEGALARYLRNPSVSVIVSNATGAVGQVRIMGRGVASPKGLPYRNGMTVLDLVVQTGGLSTFAAGNRAKIVREGRKGTHEIPVRLDDLLNKGRVSENIMLQPGDMLVIPEAWF
jgi:polysaccharide export outer membrane protein